MDPAKHDDSTTLTTAAPGNGKPIDPRHDQYDWKMLLAEAGIREARLHDARHTAATTLGGCYAA